MSEQVLRQAAALMRDRASRAESRRWYPSDTHDGMDEMEWVDICSDFPGCRGEDPINVFVESWPPLVALAVAEWLDATAAAVACGTWPPGGAEAVARAYLAPAPPAEAIEDDGDAPEPGVGPFTDEDGNPVRGPWPRLAPAPPAEAAASDGGTS